MNSSIGFYRQDDVELDGTRYTLAELKQNEESLELLELLSTVDIDPKENVAVVEFQNEEEIRRTAQLLGLESEGSINSVMANLEEVRKLDVRIAGRSNLEAPLWSELNDRQQQEYVNTGLIRFIGDPERGTQTWTRDQVLFNSRRNNDAIPDNVANLVDNTDGTWTLTIPTGNALLENTYDVAVRATDAAGNTSVDVTTNELVIDITDPTVPTVSSQESNDTTPFNSNTDK